MEDHGKRLARLGTQHDIRSAEMCIAGGGVWRKLAAHQFRKWDALPTSGTQ
jgi:hypothetical protein